VCVQMYMFVSSCAESDEAQPSTWLCIEAIES